MATLATRLMTLWRLMLNAGGLLPLDPAPFLGTVESCGGHALGQPCPCGAPPAAPPTHPPRPLTTWARENRAAAVRWHSYTCRMHVFWECLVASAKLARALRAPAAAEGSVHPDTWDLVCKSSHSCSGEGSDLPLCFVYGQRQMSTLLCLRSGPATRPLQEGRARDIYIYIYKGRMLRRREAAGELAVTTAAAAEGARDRGCLR